MLGDLEQALHLEWLLADGLGGYASSTVVGARTRREHGLLVVATRPPLARMVLLADVEETLCLPGERCDLSTNVYSGSVHPEGFRLAGSFILDPLPTLTWELPRARLSRTVARVHGEPGVVLLYRYEGPRGATLQVRPLLAYRRSQDLQRENDQLSRSVDQDGDAVVLRPYDLCPSLALRATRGAWAGDGHWYRSFDYRRDREAGRAHEEDLFSPGRFTLPLSPGGEAAVLAWAYHNPPATAAEDLVAEERRRLREAGSEVDGLTGLLKRAAAACVVRRGDNGRAILSAYPNERDPGREAPLALPGLCLATGRTREARAVLSEAARHMQTALFPARADDWEDASARGSADASLLWVLAAHRVVEATGDLGFAKLRLKDVLFAVIDALRAGTAEGFRLTPDGLIADLQPETRLLGVRPLSAPLVAIETQALWYNALLVGASLAAELGDETRAVIWNGAANRARESIQRLFWAEPAGHLADCLTPDGQDVTLRPHQLYAIGLIHGLLPADRALRVLDAVERELLTPVGLRACAPSQARTEADASIWPSLIGLYFEALIRLHGEEGKRRAREWLRDFAPRLDEAGLGFVSERFVGQPPYRAAGQIAHGPAAAELLRLCHRVAGRPPARTASARRAQARP